MATNTAALEAKLAELAERVSFLESISPQFEAKRKHADQLATVAKVKSVATVDQFRALNQKDREVFAHRATREQLVMMLRDAPSEERKLVLAAAPSGTAAAVAFELAPAPALVEAKAAVSFITRPVPLANEEHAASLKALGLPTTGRLGPHAWNLLAFTMDGGNVEVFDRDAWDARVENDPLLAKAIDDGKLTVRTLGESEAKAHAHRVFVERVNHARDLGDSRLMPSLPEV